MKVNLNVNKNLLKARTIEKGLSMSDVAKELKISSNQLSHKIAHNSFWLSEIRDIQLLLNLSADDFNNIFFEGGLSFFDIE